MNKNTRIIKISGFRGILMAIFIASCLAAGFIVFPAFAAMYAWNWVSEYVAIPVISFWQGLMLWAIVAITVFLINDRKKFVVAFGPKHELDDEEMKKVLENIQLQRAQMINSMILKSKDIDIDKKDDDSKKDKENV